MHIDLVKKTELNNSGADSWGKLNAEQLEFIGKLEKITGVFEKILKIDSSGYVMRGEELGNITALNGRAGVILEKMKKQEFEVAVVGLEKAGKSSLGNALIKLCALPDDSVRCTFTTTEIRSGDTNEARVEFYSKEEFGANFESMLEAIKFRGSLSFEECSYSDISRYLKELEANDPDGILSSPKTKNIAEDLKIILGSKSTVSSLLGRGTEILSIPDSRIYITGMENGNRGAHPYAVKKILIYSQEFKEMKNIILYDVPGFDSPVQLHKKQTEAMLKQADVIIFVVNAGTNPNLTGTQLDMLRKVSDSDGLKLCEKTFVFGNRIDLAGTSENAAKNRRELINDVIKYKIAAEECVILGSAGAYLEKNNLFSDGRQSGSFAAKLQEMGLEDNVDTLRAKLREYYNSKRFVILQKRAANIIGEAEKLLKGIIEKHSLENISVSSVIGSFCTKAKDKLETDVIENLNKICDEELEEINSQKPFTSLIESNVDRIYYNISADDDIVKRIENRCRRSNDSEVAPITDIDSRLRVKLCSDFLRNIVDQASNEASKRQKIIRRKLVDAFLESMGMEPYSKYKKELEASVNELFDRLLIENGSRCEFNCLIERFVTLLIEAVIRYPFGSIERLQRVTNERGLPEIFSLAAYYADEGSTYQNFNIEDKEKHIFAKILTHMSVKEVNEYLAPDNDVLEMNYAKINQVKLAKLFENSRNINKLWAAADIAEADFLRWGKVLSKKNVSLSYPKKYKELIHVLDETLEAEEIKTRWNQFTNDAKKRCLEDALNNHYKDYSIQDFPEAMQMIVNTLEIQNKQDMIDVLNKDIEILRDLMINAVCLQIGLERSFASVISKNINIICDADENRAVFNNWISANIDKLEYREFENINAVIEKNEAVKAIVKAVKEAAEEIKL